MTIKNKITLVATALAVAVVPAPATAGGGGKADVKVKFKLTQDQTTPNDDVFEGRLKSDRKSCTAGGRIVKLLSNGSLDDITETNADGEFTFYVMNPHQAVAPYEAKVGSTDRCKGALSKGIIAPGN